MHGSAGDKRTDVSGVASIVSLGVVYTVSALYRANGYAFGLYKCVLGIPEA